MVKRNKHGAIKKTVDGYKFDSKKEAEVYGKFKILQQAGKISNLDIHPSFVIFLNGRKICKVILDFMYYDLLEKRYKYIDVKGFDKKTSKFRVTRESAIKKKLVEAQEGIIVEYM